MASYTVRLEKEVGIKALESLYLCYEPLMGSKACRLYGILMAVADSSSHKDMEEDDLLCLTLFSKGELQAARKKLEQYQLLETYCSDDLSRWELYLRPPKEIREFLRDDIFARIMLQKQDNKRYVLVGKVSEQEAFDKTLNNVTDSINTDLLEQTWNAENEFFLQKNKPSLYNLPNNFDVDRFLTHASDRLINDRIKTPANLQKIARISALYGVNEDDMRIYVQQAVDKTSYSRIDYEKLKNLCLNKTLKATPSKKSYEELLQLEPVEFYRSISPEGIELMRDEKKFLVSLSEQYHFRNEVANELVHYCLKRTNRVFNITYMKKVANTWKSSKITTREMALDYIKNEQESMSGNYNNRRKPRVEPGLPEWYSKKATSKVTQKTLEQNRKALEAMEKEVEEAKRKREEARRNNQK